MIFTISIDVRTSIINVFADAVLTNRKNEKMKTPEIPGEALKLLNNAYFLDCMSNKTISLKFKHLYSGGG